MMTREKPTREESFVLLNEFNQNPSLINHALAVEAVMRYMARKHAEDEVTWGIIGFVHDLDYEMFPGEHCKRTEQILRDRKWPEEYIRAIVSHGWGICVDVEPRTLLEKTLYAVDELTGLITACALVRPSKSVMDLTAKSVLKKWDQKTFAAGVDRSVIAKGAERLGVNLADLITDVIAGMREVAPAIGLA